VDTPLAVEVQAQLLAQDRSMGWPETCGGWRADSGRRRQLVLDLHRLKEEKKEVELDKIRLRNDCSRCAAFPVLPVRPQARGSETLLAAVLAVPAVGTASRLQDAVQEKSEELAGLRGEMQELREQAREREAAVKELEQLRSERAELLSRAEAAERELEEGKEARAAQVR